MSDQIKEALKTAGVYTDLCMLEKLVTPEVEEKLFSVLTDAQEKRNKAYLVSIAALEQYLPDNLLGEGVEHFSEKQAEAINEALEVVVTRILGMSYIQEAMVDFFEKRYGLAPVVYPRTKGSKND